MLHGVVYVESSLLNAADVTTMNVSLDRRGLHKQTSNLPSLTALYDVQQLLVRDEWPSQPSEGSHRSADPTTYLLIVFKYVKPQGCAVARKGRGRSQTPNRGS